MGIKAEEARAIAQQKKVLDRLPYVFSAIKKAAEGGKTSCFFGESVLTPEMASVLQDDYGYSVRYDGGDPYRNGDGSWWEVIW